jgi:hypothetical protein
LYSSKVSTTFQLDYINTSSSLVPPPSSTNSLPLKKNQNEKKGYPPCTPIFCHLTQLAIFIISEPSLFLKDEIRKKYCPDLG